MCFFLYFGVTELYMKVAQLIGLFLVVAGSFLPLVHIPIIGNWDYYKIDSSLAILVWVFSTAAFLGIIFYKPKLLRFSAMVLIIIFLFTITAVKLKSLDYFSFLPFKSWQQTVAGIVTLSWGWILEFAGAILLLVIKNKKVNN